jgi:Methyltransferase domain
MITSILCRYEHFHTGWYEASLAALGLTEQKPSRPEQPTDFHRKPWEWCAIYHALLERDMLRPGRRGIGFAVGQERLPAAFASLGVEVLATDQSLDTASDAWTATGQHAASREALFYEDICSRRDFEQRVRFEAADMTRLDDLPRDEFDFTWSSCAFEHLGSLEAGLQFVERSMELLRPGGVAVHTTEYNVSSNTDTITTGNDVIYRRRDLEWLDRRLRARGCGLASMDLNPGDHPYDLACDYPPYASHGRPHIKLWLGGFICTSVLLIIQKGEAPGLEGRLEKFEREPGSVASANLESVVEKLEAELLAVRQENMLLRGSTSWRITAPLRKIVDATRR